MIRPQYLFFMTLVLVGVTACASSDGTPSGVVLILTSDVEKRPYAEEELAVPGLWPYIQACQNQFPFAECHLKKTPINNLTIFDRAVHEHVKARISLSGGEAGWMFAAEIRLYNPDGELFDRMPMLQIIPSTWNPAFTYKYWFTWTPIDQAKWQLGRWKMIFFVNGVPEIERSFEVIEGG